MSSVASVTLALKIRASAMLFIIDFRKLKVIMWLLMLKRSYSI